MLGQENITSLMGKNVLIIGLGGVGGICAEMIARAGVGKMTIVDNDNIDLSNINRQIPALHSTAGQSKAKVLGARLKDINPELDLTILEIFIKEDLTRDLLSKVKIIMIDIDHYGEMEKNIIDKLAELNFSGIIILDDLFNHPDQIINESMKNLWDNIKYKKIDVTKYGHWSGTGIVFMNTDISIICV
jgi:glutamyl-tRNA reductase